MHFTVFGSSYSSDVDINVKKNSAAQSISRFCLDSRNTMIVGGWCYWCHMYSSQGTQNPQFGALDYNKLFLSVNDRLNMKRHCSWGHWVPWVVSLWQKRPTSATYQGILKRRSLISMLQKEGRKKTSCFQHSLCFSDLPCQASLLPFFFDVKTIKWNEIWYKILLFKRKISR